MKHTITICATLVLIASFFHFSLVAQSQSSSSRANAIAMTGDADATWILTDKDELIYCWWPGDPETRTEQAKCRVLNRWRVDRIQ